MENNAKQIIYGQEVRIKILNGVEKTERAVGTTLGSKGGNVALQKNWGPPIVIHDGVTVAREVVLEDPFEDQAAQLVIGAAQKTNSEAGDGTTTATILTHAIVKEAMPIVTAGINPADIRKGIEKAIPALIGELKRISQPVKTVEEMKQVATISATSESLGDLIATAIQKVGENGVVSVQEGMGSTIEVQYKEGIDLPKGYLSPYFVTNGEKMECVLEASMQKETSTFPYVVILNEKMDNEKLVSLGDMMFRVDPQAQFLIIADDYDLDSANTLLINRLKGRKKLCAIKSPEFGEHRTDLLTDIATVVGGKVIGGSAGVPIKEITIADLGQAEKIIVSRDQTVIIGGRGNKKEIDERITALESLKKTEQEPGVFDKLEGRLAKLIGGVAVISVGASSEVEMREIKEKVYDAVNATKAAVSEGIVPGGGVALVRASKILDTLEVKGNEKIGIDIIRKAILYPMHKLITNAGGIDAGHAVGKILEQENENWGYNVETEKFEDLMKAGVIDPVKVTRTALENAASIAIMLITTTCMIVRKPETKKADDDLGIGTFQ